MSPGPTVNTRSHTPRKSQSRRKIRRGGKEESLKKTNYSGEKKRSKKNSNKRDRPHTLVIDLDTDEEGKPQSGL